MHELGAVDFPDRYKRDADGNRIPLTVYEPAPTALRVHAIKSLMPKAYNPTEVREVKNTTSVLVIGANKPRSEASEGESALVRDLRLRILELEKNGSSHPRPTAPVVVGLSNKPTRSEDDLREGHGHGPTAEQHAAAGGYRVSK